MATNSNKKTTKNTQPRILNKRATYDYAIEERYEAGLVLHGWEVKSVRAGRAQINLAHIYIRDGELFLCNAHMNPADQACTHETLETNRTRKLLMHRREINKLMGLIAQQGYTLIPLSLYFKGSRVKVQLGLCKGKKLYDKRDDMARRAAQRDIDRALRDRQKA